MVSALFSRATLGAVTPRVKCVAVVTDRRCFFDWSTSPDDTSEQRYVLLKKINSIPEKVYDVVSEVSKYQDFIPYCVESFVRKRSPVNQKPIEAGMKIGFRQYDEKFLCDVVCEEQQSTYKVIANSVSHNLFHLLYAQWTILPHPERPSSTQVELLLRFKFKSRLYNTVSSIFAKSVTELVMKAFEKRVFDLQRSALVQELDKRDTPKN